MKSWERLLTIVGVIIAIGGAVQSLGNLPYRIEQAEKAHAQLVTDLNTEKQKMTENRESLIRIEEQVKAVRQTVEAIDRRQRREPTSAAASN